MTGPEEDEAQVRRRTAMVEEQIAARGVRDPRVLDAVRRVPRERFVDPGDGPSAYDDAPLPIDCGQTISQPYIVALMVEALGLKGDERVLEIGTGSGYAAAVLGCVTREVVTVERHAPLARLAAERLAALGLDHVLVRDGDGMGGWPERAPYDAIVVAACAAEVPPALLEQLAVGGRLVLPVGPREEQSLVRIVRTEPDRYDEEHLAAVRFVPLVAGSG